MAFNPHCPVHGVPKVKISFAPGFDGLTGQPVMAYSVAGPVDASGEPRIDDGNIYIFCDTVRTGGSESLACIRGAGHNGDHLFSRLVPLMPVKFAAAVPSSPAQESEMTNDDFPRRQKLYEMTPAERAIYDAVQAVEAMAADVRLTDAVILLQAARDSVADFVDGIADVRRQVIVRDAITEANRGR